MPEHYSLESGIVAGCDEAGRGCLAGPVVAAAVILPEGFNHPLLNDSKKMTPESRKLLSSLIRKEAKAWAIGMCDHEEIDQYNILKASFMAMHRAINQLTIRPSILIIDGNRFTPYTGIQHRCFVGGDGLYTQIAAASVLAKTERDEMMMELHRKYPQYGWDKNKAYATLSHRKALMTYGYSPFHRKSFRLNYQMKLSF
jgi:ribonuclease HII